MSGGWEVGDLALCVKVGPWRSLTSGALRTSPIRAGMVVTVCKVGIGVSGMTVLWFDGHCQSGKTREAYCARRFRKIAPPKADEFDREVIDLMLGKPVPVEA